MLMLMLIISLLLQFSQWKKYLWKKTIFPSLKRAFTWLLTTLHEHNNKDEWTIIAEVREAIKNEMIMSEKEAIRFNNKNGWRLKDKKWKINRNKKDPSGDFHFSKNISNIQISSLSKKTDRTFTIYPYQLFFIL